MMIMTFKNTLTLLTVAFLSTATFSAEQAVLKDDSKASSRQDHKKEHRTLLFADHLSYDQKKEIIHASGHVEVSRGELTLYADKIVYDQREDKIIALGNVRLLDAKNNLTFTDRFELSGDLKEGVSKAVQGIMADESLYAANKVKRKKGTITQLDQVVYSPCEVCRKDPSKSPTWLIKSRHMVWDELTGDITHADSTLEMWGVPVMYTPYLSHPGPTVKRRSGFLTPFFGGSGNLGAIVGTPYYWAIDDAKDLTITPIYTRENPLLWLKYRQSFCNGEWNIETSVTKSRFKEGPKGQEVSSNKLRGHLKTKGHFSLTENSFAGFDIHRALDDTYLKKYRFLGVNHDSFLTSRIYAESFWDRNYALIESINYQSLRQEDTAAKIPFIVPSAELNLLSKPTALDGAFFLDTSILNLQRRRGQNMKRFSTEGGWKAQWTSSLGTITDFAVHGRWDFYRVTNLTLSDSSKYSGQRVRFSPKANVHIKYPFYKVVKGGRFVIEPIAGVVVASNNRNSQRIPNEDSSLFELSDTNIFAPNRMTGLDLVDQWSRFNYGAKVAYYSKDIGNSELFFGQTHSLTKVSKDLNSRGLQSHQSDYVLRANYTYSDWVEMTSRLLINKKDLSAKRNESTLSVGQPIFKANATYTRFPKVTIPGISIEQLTYGATSQLTKHWSIQGTITQELGRKGGKLSQGASLTFKDECFTFTSSLVKTFFQDRDFKPGLTVMFKLSFKNLGDVQVSGDQLGLGYKPQAVETKDNNENIAL